MDSNYRSWDEIYNPQQAALSERSFDKILSDALYEFMQRAKTWLLIITTCILIILVTLLTGILLGIVNMLIATMSLKTAINGAIAGTYLGFSALGAQTSMLITQPDMTTQLFMNYTPLLYIPMFVTIVWYAYKFYSRLSRRIDNEKAQDHRAMVIRISLTFGLIAALSAALFTQGDRTSDLFSINHDQQDFVGYINMWQASLQGAIYVFIVGLFYCRHINEVFFKRPRLKLYHKLDEDIRENIGEMIDSIKLKLQSPSLKNAFQNMFEGAKIYFMIAICIGVVGLAGSFFILDSVSDRILMLTSLPLHFGHLNIAMVTVAMGGSVAVSGYQSDHLSLMNWEWNKGELAPVYMFLTLAIVPTFVFWRTGIYLSRRYNQADTINELNEFDEQYALDELDQQYKLDEFDEQYNMDEQYEFNEFDEPYALNELDAPHELYEPHKELDELALLRVALWIAAGFTITSLLMSFMGSMHLEASVASTDKFISENVDQLARNLDEHKHLRFTASPESSFLMALMWSFFACVASVIFWGKQHGFNVLEDIFDNVQKTVKPKVNV